MKKTRSLLAVLICLALLVSLCAVSASAANTVTSTLDFTTLAATEDFAAVAEAVKGLGAVDCSNLIVENCYNPFVAGKGYAGEGHFIQKIEAGEGKVFAEAPVVTLNYRLASASPMGYIKVEGSIDGETYYPFAELKEATGTSLTEECKATTTVTLEGGQGSSAVWVKVTIQHWGSPDAGGVDKCTITANVKAAESEPILPENAVQTVADFRTLNQFAGGGMPNEQDEVACAEAFAAAKAAMEDLGLTVPEDSGPWVLQNCHHIFATPIHGYNTCSVIQTLEAGEGKVFSEDVKLTAGYWLAKVGDPSSFRVEVSTDGENWTEAYADKEGRGTEWDKSAYTEGTITLPGTKDAAKVYVKISVERHSGQTTGGLSFSTLTGLTKDAPKVEETDPTVPETDPTVPETDPTVPETDPTVPETDPTVPETDPTVPETDPTVPETDPTVPETDPTVPETDPTVPETDPTVPETDPTVPATDPTPTEPSVSKPVTSVIDFEALSEFAGITSPDQGDIAATKAKMEEMGLILPDRIGWFENAEEDANHNWVLQNCFNIFLTPRDGYQNCAYIQVLDAGEGNVLKDDAVLTLKYWLAKVNDPSYIVVEVSTDGENWEEAWANEEGFGAEFTADACTEENITLEGTAGASKVYVKIVVNRHGGQTAGGVVKSAITGVTKGASDVEETTPATDGGQTPPETGDAINVVIAMLAVSGLAITVLKKKEN